MVTLYVLWHYSVETKYFLERIIVDMVQTNYVACSHTDHRIAEFLFRRLQKLATVCVNVFECSRSPLSSASIYDNRARFPDVFLPII